MIEEHLTPTKDLPKGNADDLDRYKKEIILDEKLISIPHCYGAHGDCGEDIQYIGEADSWGIEAWEKGMKFMELGSEFALDLIENEEKLGCSEEYRRNASSYADRYTHLFLNQISTLVNEVDFHLQQGISRLGFGLISNIDPSLTETQKKSILYPVVQKVLEDTIRSIQTQISLACQKNVTE